ncbi:septation protein IspZ [Buchnera aphidicola]|uniref:septation protein IspZ n=1 Tax=Buchnera aphidicola TaxID=9 RepID=UPI0034639901
MINLLDIFSMLIFYIIYIKYNIFLASIFLLLSSIFSLLIHIKIYKKIDLVNLINFLLIIFIALNSMIYKNFLFIQWKVTVLNIILSITLLINQFFMKKTFIEKIFEKKINIPNEEWKKINFFWALFFIFLGTFNAYIILNFSEITWIKFKIFGIVILTSIAFLLNLFYVFYIKNKKK